MISDNIASRRELISLLGNLPEFDRPVTCEKIGEEERETYVLEKLVLDLNGEEPVGAYFAKPKETKGQMPAVLFNHSHGGAYHLGKDEFIKGNVYLQEPVYAEELTGMGYYALCIDAWGFGERRGRSESEIYKEMLWTGKVMWGMMVYDSLRAVDYLVSRPEVDSSKIATLGISMGGTMSWWVSALDERIRCCIDLCSLTDYHALLDARSLDAHSIYYYVPNLLKHFTTSRINELIAPRAHYSFAGNFDKLTPSSGLDVVDRNMTEVYAREDASDRWKLFRYHTGHFETADMRAKIKQLLADSIGASSW